MDESESSSAITSKAMSNTCAESLAAHIDAIGDILATSGVNATCRYNYEALVELAEILRLLGSHASYTTRLAQERVDRFRAVEAQLVKLGRTGGRGE